MPSLNEARDKVRELAKKGLDAVQDDKMTPAEQKKQLDAIDVELKAATETVADLEHLDVQRKRFLGVTGSHIEDAGAAPQESSAAKTLGEQFIESAGYKNLRDRGMKGGRWSTGDVELKTTLTEGTAAVPGPGWASVSTPTVLPGIVDIRFRPLVISDLFPQGTTDTPLIRYMVESSVTNAAATVAEGALKPESALTFASVDETLRKIATFLPVSDEMLEDFAQIQSYINNRLTLFVKLAEEAQLLSGNGTAPNLVGLLNRTGLATTIVKGTAPSVAGDTTMDAIFRQVTAIRTTSYLEPDAIVMDPLAWQTVTLSKNAQGAYYAGGPFVDVATPMLWGKRVVVTPAMAANTALVGCFSQGAQVFRKGGITVEASNSHVDFFQKNLTAIRCEERLALAVYRPGAFGSVTGL